jgi:hypothetical protein
VIGEQERRERRQERREERREKSMKDKIKEKLCKMFGCDKAGDPGMVVISFGAPSPKKGSK